MPSDCSEDHRVRSGVRPRTRSREWARPGRRRRILLLALFPLMAWPVAGEARSSGGWSRGAFPVVEFAGFTSPFGMRIHPLHGGLRPHQGLDIAAPLGSAIRSWWTGTVSEVIHDGGCGIGLVIRSGHYEHIYCHLDGHVSQGVYRSSGVAMHPGRRVRTGEVIGHVGLTGSTTGPHLHWGLRHQGRWLDPARVLRAMAAARRLRSPNPWQTPSVGYYR